jgi:hypothetical protein
MNDNFSNFLKHLLHPGSAVLATIILGYTVIKGVKYAIASKRYDAVYPPGPTRLPFIKTLRSFPKDHFFRRFCEWATVYGASIQCEIDFLYKPGFLGDIVYAPLPGMDVVVLNSYEIAQELLSKRFSSTGERRRTYFLVNM